jgi:hypothetical protein
MIQHIRQSMSKGLKCGGPLIRPAAPDATTYTNLITNHRFIFHIYSNTNNAFRRRSPSTAIAI